MSQRDRMTEKQQQFIEKLVAFRSALSKSEQQLLDGLVASALDGEVWAHAAQGAALPATGEVEQFVRRLKAFQTTLPPDEQQAIDALVRKASAPEEADVEAHVETLLWRFTSSEPGALASYQEMCAAEGSLFNPTWLESYEGMRGTVYECWRSVFLEPRLDPIPRFP